MTLPPLVKDWPADARFEWRERVAIRLEQWGGKAASAEVERQHEREAETDVRQAWARRM